MLLLSIPRPHCKQQPGFVGEIRATAELRELEVYANAVEWVILLQRDSEAPGEQAIHSSSARTPCDQAYTEGVGSRTEQAHAIPTHGIDWRTADAQVRLRR